MPEMKKSMPFELQNLVAAAEAIARLLHPYAEVVIHDLKTDKIVAIFNSFSKRKIGSPSLLKEESEFLKEADMIGPYEKTNWDGNPLKSISSVIKDNQSVPCGLLCINLDISVLDECQALIQAFMHKMHAGPRPNALFKNDWQERINQYIHSFLQEKNWHFKTLTAMQKKAIVANLHQQGAFTGKNSAQYIAQILKVSRATVYNYLNAKN